MNNLGRVIDDAFALLLLVATFRYAHVKETIEIPDFRNSTKLKGAVAFEEFQFIRCNTVRWKTSK